MLWKFHDNDDMIEQNVVKIIVTFFRKRIFEKECFAFAHDFTQIGMHLDSRPRLRTAVCRIIKGFAFYSSKRPILRVIGGAEGVVPHPHNGGSK